MTHVPDWWQFLLLGLAAFRLTRLGSYDDLTIPLRRWVTGMGDEEHHQWAHVIDHQREIGEDPWIIQPTPGTEPPTLEAGQWTTVIYRLRAATGKDDIPPIPSRAPTPVPPVSERRYYASKLIRCAWCFGAWISLLVWVLWLAWPHAVQVVSVPLALMAVVGLVAKRLDP